jgi:hypothetical protein
MHRARLFANLCDTPYDFRVHRWEQYRSDVHNLHKSDLLEIDSLVDLILGSASTPAPVRGVLLQGHADYDLRRSGKAREEFEHEISKKRANAVFEYIKKSFATRPITPEQEAVLVEMAWKKEALGSTQRIFKPAKNEDERSQNRRVDIFVAHASNPIHFGSVMFCPHGGRVERANPVGLPESSDFWFVIGCPFFMSNLTATPCFSVFWVTSDEGVIDANSIGLCMSSTGIPQGTVVIIADPTDLIEKARGQNSTESPKKI